MRIGILYNHVEHLNSGREAHLVSLNEGQQISRRIETVIGDSHEVIPIRATLDVGKRISQGCLDIVFNVCEGFGEDARGESWVAAQLEMAGVAFTGSDSLSLALCQNKVRTKEMLVAAGIRTPAFQVMASPSEQVEGRLRWPLFVKPVREDASEGISQESVVSDVRALAAAIERIVECCGQPALVEEYIDGRELNVAFLGDGPLVETLPVSEILFDAVPGLHRIVDFESKWVAGSPSWEGSCRAACPAELSETEYASVVRAAGDSFRLLGCRDYARVDIRLREGVPYVLEVNPNPCLGGDSGFFRSANAVGLSYDEMVWRILRCAMARHGVDEKATVSPQEKTVSGKLVCRGVRTPDISSLLEWFNDEDTSAMMDDPHIRYTREELFDAFFLRDSNDVDLVFCLLAEEVPVGFASIYNINKMSGSGEISFLIGNRRKRGNGLGREMVDLLLDYAFNKLRMKRLEATVLPANVPCLRLLKSMGFREVGTFRERFCNGSMWSDEIIFERLNEASH